MASTSFYKAISDWYRRESRSLPWRNTQNPYKIWLSEIIMQQTRVSQGLPYYLKFEKKFPTLESLACASEEHVLRIWQGLGYYSRARNLLKCARLVIRKYDGRFPDSFNELLKLPGIGPYTAAAISSFAFGHAIPAIDGNALRVFSRYFAIKEDIRKKKTAEKISGKATSLMAGGEPLIFNQAVMELGATICVPRTPKCNECPVHNGCIASENNLISQIPYKSKHKPGKSRFFTYLILRQASKIALSRRSGDDIWKGLFEFYLMEDDRLMDPSDLHDELIDGIRKHASQIEILGGDVRHQLSHQVIISRFIQIRMTGAGNNANNQIETAGLRFYSEREIVALPKPVLINNLLTEYIL